MTLLTLKEAETKFSSSWHLVIKINFLQSITCWCQWGWEIVSMFTVPYLRQHQHLWVRGSLHCGKECSPLSQWSRKQTQLHWPSSWRPRGIKISRHSEHVECFLELTKHRIVTLEHNKIRNLFKVKLYAISSETKKKGERENKRKRERESKRKKEREKVRKKREREREKRERHR